jgi:alcohol dehydrogenase
MADFSHELRKYVAPEFVFGEGALELVGQYARNLGATRVVLVTDPGVIAAGWVSPVVASLGAAAVESAIYSNVTPNPRAEEVMAGAELYHREGCDGIVAVGGGSAIDCAKGIGTVVVEKNRHVLEFEGVDRVSAPMPPTVCIPTTAGTSADVSQFAIIADLHTKRKVAIISKALVPDISLIDPRTLATIDRYLAACTAIDALVHAIEAFVSSGQSPITDTHALEAIRLVYSAMSSLSSGQADFETRRRLMLGSLQAGLAFSNASLGAVHAMAHSLGGALDLPHGECNSILLEHVIEFNFSAAPERYAQIASAMLLPITGVPARRVKKELLTAVRAIKQTLGINATLGQRGVHRSDVRNLAAGAMRDPCLVTNPRIPNQRDLETVYEQAL